MRLTFEEKVNLYAKKQLNKSLVRDAKMLNELNEICCVAIMLNLKVTYKIAIRNCIKANEDRIYDKMYKMFVLNKED